MTGSTTARRHYWRRHTDGGGTWRSETGRPPGEELAALRRGIGRDAGSVPQMWPFYTTLAEDGRRTPALLAEHVALTLFAVHQQSRPLPVHRDGVGLGTAVLALRRSDAYSPEAVDRRFAAAATATSLAEVGVHLRGLVTQLRGIGQSLDYTRLYQDLRDWQYPERLPLVRRRWGGQYFASAGAPASPRQTESAAPTTAP